MERLATVAVPWEHFAPMFVTPGAASDPEQAAERLIDGFRMGLSKRSFPVR